VYARTTGRKRQCVSDVRLSWLQPTPASPHGVKPGGWRRAQARFCQWDEREKVKWVGQQLGCHKKRCVVRSPCGGQETESKHRVRAVTLTESRRCGTGPLANASMSCNMWRPCWASAPSPPSRKWERMRAKCVPHVATQSDAQSGKPW
jgi:hypothetical protein